MNTADDPRRAEFSRQITATLFPTAPHPGGGTVDYLAVPHLRSPRVLVPLASPQLAAATLRQHARPGTWRARLRQEATIAALHTGADKLLARDRLHLPGSPADFRCHLRGALGTEPHFGIHIGPERASRKPVIQVLNAEARTVAYAKMGRDGLARRLVDAETTALRTLAGVRLLHTRIPQVWHRAEWHGHGVLVQEALPAWRRPARPDPIRLLRAMRELAGCLGTEDLRLGSSEYAEALRGRVRQLAQHHESGDSGTLLTAMSRLLDRHANHRLRFGSWHGDWTPWNMAMLADTVLLWDFERFCGGVPLGFDVLHFTLQRDLGTFGIDATTAVLSLLADCDGLLEPFGLSPAAARLVTLLYLVELATRYFDDRRAASGSGPRDLGSWLLPTLLRHVTATEDVVRS